MAPITTFVHVTSEELADLKNRLGPYHALYLRAQNAVAEVTDPEVAKYRDAACRRARIGELEVDEGAIVVGGDQDGAYVMAWLWVANDELVDFDTKKLPGETPPEDSA